MADEDEQAHLTGNEARGGTEVGAMRYVLAISMILVVAIFIVILWAPFG